MADPTDQPPASRIDSIQSHYSRHSSDSYTAAWFYAERTPYQYFLANEIQNVLDLQLGVDRDALLDVGCGTGSFTRFLCEVCAPNTKPGAALGIDPYLEFDKNVTCSGSLEEPGTDVVGLLRITAADYLSGEVERQAVAPDAKPTAQFCNKILFKEVVHHFESEEGGFEHIFRLVHDYFLNGSGRRNGRECRATILTRETDPSHYPFFSAAKERWQKDQKPADYYATKLRDACGFNARGCGDVEVRTVEFPVRMPLQRWKAMLRARFWSTFAAFSDDEIEAGIQEMGSWERFAVPSESRCVEKCDGASECQSSPDGGDSDFDICFTEKLVLITAFFFPDKLT